MNSILRKIRGAVGTAITWAVAWAIVGAAVLGVIYVVDPDFRDVSFWNALFWDMAGPLIGVIAGSGLIAGGVFSLVLGTVYRNRRVGDLSPKMMALWGTGAALLLPGALLGLATGLGIPIYWDLMGVALGSVVVLGAGTGAGIIKVAQAGDGQVGPPDVDDLLGSGE